MKIEMNLKKQLKNIADSKAHPAMLPKSFFLFEFFSDFLQVIVTIMESSPLFGI